MGNCVKSPQSTDSTDMTVIHGKVPDPPKSVDPTPPDDRYVKSDIQKPPPVADKPTRRPSQDNSAIDPAEAEARRMKQLVAELINSGYDTIWSYDKALRSALRQKINYKSYLKYKKA